MTRGRRAEHARYVASTVRQLAPGPARLADVLAAFRARGQAAQPSQAWLARRLDVTVRTIRRWTHALERAGVLVVTRHPARPDHLTGRLRRRTNRYRCRFREAKRDRTGGNVQVTPSGHFCPQKSPDRDGKAGAVPTVEASPDLDPPPEAPTRPPWLAAGVDAAAWTLRKMGRP